MKTKLMSVDYLGFTAMDKRFSSSMLPWILLEIRRRGTREKLCLGVENGSLLAYDINFELQFTHKLSTIMRFTQVQSSPTEFLYLVKDSKELLLYCYLFQASTVEEVTELFGHMKELAPHGGSLQSINKSSNGSDAPTSAKSGATGKILPPNIRPPVATNKGFNPISPASSVEHLSSCSVKSAPSSSNIATSKSYTTGLNKSGTSVSNDSNSGPVPLVRSLSNTSNLTSLCVDISPSNSHFFEVLYIGKIKVSHKKVPDTLIDEALGKFQQYEVEKVKAAQMRRNSLLSTHTDSSSIDLGSMESVIPQHGKKVEFAPLPLPYKKSEVAENNKNHDGLMSPSLTPLETSKKFFGKSEDDEDDSNIEKEFDQLSTERVTQTNVEQTLLTKPLVLNKKSFPVALEPNVLILNTSQNETKNLATLTEDEDESSQMNNCDTNLRNNMDTELHITEEENISSSKSSIKTSDILVSSEKNLSDINIEKLKRLNSESDASSLSETRDLFDCNQEEQLVNLLKNKTLPENKYFARDRSASIGTLNLHKTPISQLIGDQNRTMLFQVGRSDLRLISPDRKQVLLHKQLRDVASCVQGVSNREHFGFICREPDMECFVGYVFKCQSEGVSSDVVGAITQAFVAHAEFVKQGKEKSPFSTCEHCPMIWYHKLCQELEGMTDKKIRTTILRRIEQLGEEEQELIMTKYLGGTDDLYEVGEHNAFLMMLLRAHCEAKQQRHVHDTVENRSEFLNQYLGGSTIFMKAKRSLSSSFDHLLKRKASKDDFSFKDVLKKENSPTNHSITPTKETIDHANGKTNPVIPKIKAISDNQSMGPDITLNLVQNGQDHEQSPSAQLKSPMMDIFMKLGSNPTPKSHSLDKSLKKQNDSTESSDSLSDRHNNQGSWRQAIFNRVAQTGTLLEESEASKTDPDDIAAATTGDLLRRPPSFSNLNLAYPRKRNKEEIRELWKKGINQAILLIRMEKENARLRARQEVSAVKRIKLEYEDIGGCANENSKVWDMLTAHRDSRISTRVDSQMLLQAIRHGVPRAKRGEVWYFLAEQFCLRQPPPDTKNFPNYSVPYESLLKQLTSHQHAILIDLGRTFPNHTYFSSPLGPGQLALFNLLKAYSLLDPEVGYCQGLSFVAGVLLLHLDEAEAFLMLRHLMFRRGLRKQYLPDMIALQIQLYQLSRLLKDHIPELYDKFDEYDVSPTLYAAPWILTIFTSQFPLGFVTRVFDLLFLESSEVIFRVAISLLDIHKDGIMLCESFEEIMEYLKYKMPNIDKPMLDKVIKMAFTLDFGRQLHEYQVEYSVLQEEMAAIAPKMEALTNLEIQNKRLQDQNRQLLEQLEVSASKISECQVSQKRLDNQVKNLEQTVAMLARYIGTTYDKKVELPNDVRKLCQQVQQNDRKTLGVLGQKLGHSFSSKFSTTDFNNKGFPSSAFSEESSSDPDEKNSTEKVTKKPSILKTGLSAPNLFNKDPNKSVPPPKAVMSEMEKQALEKKRQFLSMKKSQSCNAGLMTPSENDQKIQKQNSGVAAVPKIPPNLKGYPLRVLDEDSEYEEKPKSADNFDTLSSFYISDTSSIASDSTSNISADDDKPKKGSKFFANSHELIRKEKLQAEQLKKDFDENLRKLDSRLSPNKSNPSILNINTDKTINLNLDHKNLSGDSGLGTPVSPPNDKLSPEHTFTEKEEIKSNTLANHPLIGADVDVKFEVQNTKLKSLRPIRFGNPFSRTSSIESSDSRN